MQKRGSVARRLSIAGRQLTTWRFTWPWVLGVARSFITSFLALTVSLWLLPGKQVIGDGPESVATLVVTVLVIGSLLRPFLTAITVLTGSLGLLLAGLLAQSLILGIALALVPTVRPFTLLEVVVASWAATVVAAGLNWMFDSSTEEAFLGQVMGRAIRIARRNDVRGPGLLIVQLDGVSEPLLRHAITSGAVPTLTRLLRSDSHRLRGWSTGVPSTTPAGQAVLLHGNTTAVPAFRWYDKTRGRVLVCSRPSDVAEVERDFSDGNGLLRDGGVSVSNLFSGDAPTRALTMSDARLPYADRGAASFFNSRTGFARSLVLFVGQMATEWHQGRRQRRRDVVPRVPRGGAFVFLRPLTTVILRDLNLSIVAEQMAGGAPVVFVDFVDYDEVAHHAGPSRPESLRTLESLDRALRFFLDLAEEVGRDYEVAVVSDHGQAQGSTFRQLSGRSLAEVVQELVGPGTHDPREDHPPETWGPANMLRAGAPRSGRMMTRAAHSAAGRQPDDPDCSLGHVVALASGSLAHVYLTEGNGRVARERVDEIHPALVHGLATHPQVGAAVTRRADGTLVAENGSGWRVLTTDGALGGEGLDPLQPYGPYAARDLVDLDAKDHVGDIVLLGRFDPSLGEVAAFEELVGSHGGLGGGQTEALLIHPADWSLGAGALDGRAVHEALVRRLEVLGLRAESVQETSPATGTAERPEVVR